MIDGEKRFALIHRVMIPESDYPKEYAILVTDKRPPFILQKESTADFGFAWRNPVGLWDRIAHFGERVGRL
jgi:hypothetical protein